VIVSPPPDAELIRRTQAGDHHAFGELVDRHRAVAFRTAWLIARSRSEAEDAMQEGFIKAWRALPRFRTSAPFRPWLLTIVANEARSRRRAEQRLVRLADRAAGEHEVAPASLEAALLTREQDAELMAALLALAQRDRRVIVCRCLLELSVAETAAVLGCRSGTVKSQLSRALGRLRETLEERDAAA
jgi:RNA polymerase sigma-70 factor (ECF subfamily)